MSVVSDCMGLVQKSYVLAEPSSLTGTVPELDAEQRRVLHHRGGPLLVLAGPGTGKTTTLVETVARRILSGELTADQVLMLTFSRKAAEELRARIASRIGGAHIAVPTMTFHAYCYALVREFGDAEAYEGPPMLMTAPERDAVFAELLAGHEASTWPASLHEALGTRGFAAEVQSFMDQAASLGMTPDELAATGVERGNAAWPRIAELISEYRDVIALRNLVDYPGLIDRAVGMAGEPRIREELRSRHRLVVVDEYQDTDPLQVELLQQIAGDGRELIVVGDPDQSIYAFRGADQRGILRFVDDFSGPERTVPVVALQTTRRFGSEILRAAACTLHQLPLPSGPMATAMRQHRVLTSVNEDPGQVETLTFVNETAEGEHIAGLLRRAHLDDGVPWSDMAVLVRTADDITWLSRLLLPAGVPVQVAGDEIPLSAEPAVRHLLAGLEAADAISRGEPISHELAQVVLAGPLGGLDGSAQRRLGRALRRRDPHTPSDELIVRALSEPTLLGVPRSDQATADAVATTARLARLLASAAASLSKGAPPEQALWQLWEGTAWPRALRRAWESGGEARARADRDLDALTALFRHAARVEEHGRKRSVVNLLAELRAQQIPADQLSSDTVGANAVRLMTAHRSKGLEWQIVVVAGVQEGVWPNLRAAGSLLRAETLEAPDAQARGAQLREERRLFYVACTRARSRLVVTAVNPSHDDGDEPSRFLSELITEFADPGEPAQALGRPKQPVSLRGVVARLRSLGEDPDTSPEDRAEAAVLLARLASTGLPQARSADPVRWWGIHDLSEADEPLRKLDEPVQLSASLVNSIDSCPLQWFLAREVKGEHAKSLSANLGSVVHAIAKDLADRSLDPEATEPDLAMMRHHLDEVWDRLDYDSVWQRNRAHADAGETLERLDTWHHQNNRRILAAEHGFKVTIDVDGEDVILRGSMDRVEQDPDSEKIHVVDFKTGSSAPSAADLEIHPQLGFYQVAIEQGAAEELPGAGQESGGAELVHLAQPRAKKAPTDPKVQQQAPLGPDAPAMDQIRRALEVIRTETLEATPPTMCKFCQFKAVCPTTTTVTIGGIDS